MAGGARHPMEPFEGLCVPPRAFAALFRPPRVPPTLERAENVDFFGEEYLPDVRYVLELEDADGDDDNAGFVRRSFACLLRRFFP